jgi:protein ImuB
VSRIACLHVSDFALAALLRTEPELRDAPLVVVESEDPGAPLLAVSSRARALGIRPEFSLAQARAAAGRLVVRRAGPPQLQAAQAALLDVAESYSPRVEDGGSGTVFLDVEGLSALFGTEAHLATSLAARAHRVGLDVGVGIAGTKLASYLAARTGGVEVLAPDEERRRLAPLPLAWLRPQPATLATLERWGIATLGDLARLPGAAVARRLGRAGFELWRRARGEDSEPIVPCRRPPIFEETVDLEFAIDSLERLSFPLRAALERLLARLALRGLRTHGLELRFRLEGGGWEERFVRVAAPTVDAKVLLLLVRTNLEGQPPRSPILELRLRALAERSRPVELDLFAPSGPLPEEIDAAIARLSALAGADRVGTPVVHDSHRPDAFGVARFDPARTRSERGGGIPGGSSDGLPALRVFRPPVPLEVACDRDRPDFLRAAAARRDVPLQGRVVACVGPWRLEGEWWSESPLGRDDYDVAVSDGCVYRIYREHRSGRWYAHGVYD